MLSRGQAEAAYGEKASQDYFAEPPCSLGTLNVGDILDKGISSPKFSSSHIEKVKEKKKVRLLSIAHVTQAPNAKYYHFNI